MNPPVERWSLRDGRGMIHFVEVVPNSVDDQLYLLRTMKRLIKEQPPGMTIGVQVDELVM